MARALWTGFVSFGLVSVPVGMFRAADDQTVHFNQINKNTGHRIRYKKVDEVTGDEVPASDIVNGHDMGDGEYVIVTKEELKDAAPGKSELMEISDFVDLAAIDPVYFRQSYYLAPRGKGADRAYSLLRQAMQESNKIGIATLVLRDKEHLVAIRPADDVLILETMYFPAEIRTPSEELESLPEKVAFEGRELTVAKTLVESLTVDWEPERYHNTYRSRIEELIEAKRDGKAVVAKTEKPKTNVVDLMSALEASVARTGKTSRPASNGDKPASNGGRAASANSASNRKSGQPALEKLSKAKLSELAAEFDIAGRSSMNKDDLVSALNDAGASAKKRKAAASA
jgi:DNA end-binding protein Ku